MRAIFFQILVAILVLHFTQSVGLSQSKVESEITVCNLPLPKSIKQAKADFTLSYSFELDESGTPSNVTKVRDTHVGKADFVKCVQDWRLKGFPRDAKFVSMFKWKHGHGWTEILIIGDLFSQVLRIKKGIGY